MTKKIRTFDEAEVHVDEPKFEAMVASAGAIEAPAPVARRTPAAWADAMGHIRKADPRLPQTVTHASPVHAAADQLHGWTQHAYHFQADPFEISQADYEAALDAGFRFPLCGPHLPALPSSQVDRFKDFVPARARVRSKESR